MIFHVTLQKSDHTMWPPLWCWSCTVRFVAHNCNVAKISFFLLFVRCCQMSHAKLHSWSHGFSSISWALPVMPTQNLSRNFTSPGIITGILLYYTRKFVCLFSCQSVCPSIPKVDVLKFVIIISIIRRTVSTLNEWKVREIAKITINSIKRKEKSTFLKFRAKVHPVEKVKQHVSQRVTSLREKWLKLEI